MIKEQKAFMNFTKDELLTIMDWFNGYVAQYYGTDLPIKNLPENHKKLIDQILEASDSLLDPVPKEIIALIRNEQTSTQKEAYTATKIEVTCPSCAWQNSYVLTNVENYGTAKCACCGYEIKLEGEEHEKICKDCGCKMSECVKMWKDQRKCCPDCKCEEE